MSKLAIGGVVGGILVFFWQFLSWGPLNLHAPQQRYTEKQDTILSFLSQQFSEDGFYFMPGLPEGASGDEYEKAMEANAGKPWAQVYYHKSWNTNMGMNMVRGLVANILAALLLCWILLKISNNSFQITFIASIAVGIISYLTNGYATAIWFEVPSMPDLIDAIVAWALCGGWLGWWLNR